MERVAWNAELLRADLAPAIQQLKQQPGNGLFVGGVQLPLALAELGLIDEYEFIVHPYIAGHGPTLFAGLSNRIALKLVGRVEFNSGALALQYEPRGSSESLRQKAAREKLELPPHNRFVGPRWMKHEGEACDSGATHMRIDAKTRTNRVLPFCLS